MCAALFLLLYVCIYFCKPCSTFTTKHVISIPHCEADSLLPILQRRFSSGNHSSALWIYTFVRKCTLRGHCKEIKPVGPKGDQSWIFIGRTDVEAEAPILWPPDVKNRLSGKRPWGWERLKAGREADNRGWDGGIASPTQWTWVWVDSGSWRWTGMPGLLQSMGSQRVGHDWATEQQGAAAIHALGSL